MTRNQQLNRDIIKNLTFKYFKTKYQGNVLGFLWSFITPSVSIFAYYFAFNYVLKVKDENHLLYLIGAVIHWRLFSTSFPAIANSFMANKDILQKISLNRLLIPFSVFSFNLITFIIMLFAFIILFHFIGGRLSLALLFYPLYLVLYFTFIFGSGIMLSTLAVRFRDIPNIIEVVLLLAFWFTPIVYNYHRIPEKLFFMVYLNPFATFIIGMEQIFYDATFPDIKIFIAMLCWSSLALSLGYYLFKKNIFKALEVL